MYTTLLVSVLPSERTSPISSWITQRASMPTSSKIVNIDGKKLARLLRLLAARGCYNEGRSFRMVVEGSHTHPDFSGDRHLCKQPSFFDSPQREPGPSHHQPSDRGDCSQQQGRYHWHILRLHEARCEEVFNSCAANSSYFVFQDAQREVRCVVLRFVQDPTKYIEFPPCYERTQRCHGDSHVANSCAPPVWGAVLT
jgi:hypothetical protein